APSRVPRSARSAITYCLPGGWRSLSATLDTRTRFPLPVVANRISGLFPGQPSGTTPWDTPAACPILQTVPGTSKTAHFLYRHAGVPLAAFGQDVPQQHDIVGHHPVGAQAEGALDVLPGVQRPHVYVQSQVMGPPDEFPRRDLPG